MTRRTAPGSVAEVFGEALRLGLTSFGGPVAHLGYFRDAYVRRLGWLDESEFADLVALGQVLPGPMSSQVGMAIGIVRAGLPGGAATWLGFTLPSAILLVLVAAGAAAGVASAGLVAGLKLAAVAVVAQAVLSMGRTLTPDVPRLLVAVLAAVAVLVAPTPVTQLAVIAAGGLVGWAILGRLIAPSVVPLPSDASALARLRVGRWTAILALVLFLGLLVGLPVAVAVGAGPLLELTWAFYRAGSLVFGGGHVVLPLLEASVVGPGWLSQDTFLAGYGATQAVPGPLFSFAAYVGALAEPGPGGVTGAALALVAIFLPGALLVVAALPTWSALRGRPGTRMALLGVNAAVVGILGAALVTPVAASAIADPVDLALAVAGAAALSTGRVPSVVVTLALAALGAFGVLGA